MTPLKAIRAKCIECCCGNMAEVRRCPIKGCALYEFRMGHNPNIKLTEEQRLKKAQEARERFGHTKGNIV